MIYKFLCVSMWIFLVSTTSKEDVISWRDNTKLTWKEFKGKPQKSRDVVAVTASGITFEYSISENKNNIVGFKTTVNAHFYPQKSWVVKSEATDHILAHEQLHFDITELYVRKFRYEISKLRVTNHLKRDLQRLHDNINKELATTQNRYDAETNNSIDREQQEKWAKGIKNGMTSLKAFKSKD